MKRPDKALILLFAVILSLTFGRARLFANVYASQLEITNPDGTAFDGDFSDGSGAHLSFFLNDDATVVTVSVVESGTGAVVAEIDAGALSAGPHAVEWDGTGAEAGKRYLVQITAEQPNASTTDWTVFLDTGDSVIRIFTRGVDVVTDQTDLNFGLIFTSNDGGPLGTGINIYDPDGTFHDPFLVAADVTSGGDVTYGTMAPFFVTSDYLGRLYVSLIDLGQVMRIDRDYSARVVMDGLNQPKGLYVAGEGDNLVIYTSTRTQILRATIGTADTVTADGIEVVAEFSNLRANQIILDDDGFLYATLRNQTIEDDGKGLRKYDLTGTLPVTDDQAVWFLNQDKTFIANDLVIDRGPDRTSASDDILYYSTRAGVDKNQDGIWRIDDINSFFPDTLRVITEQDLFTVDDNNVSTRSTFDFDAAGNIIFMENANEHIFFISPPGEGESNSFTTTSPETIAVDVAVSVAERGEIVPATTRLEVNYPNPFNPSTTISYVIAGDREVTLKIYNLRGEEIRTLVNDFQTAGEHATVWDGKDTSGNLVSSGVYIVTLTAGTFRQSQRVTLLK